VGILELYDCGYTWTLWLWVYL